jgi:cytochrome c-type biogenesis protein CcmF
VIADIGITLLWTAFALSCVQCGLLACRGKLWYATVLPASSITTLLALSGAFATLIYAFAISDFSLNLVVNHSHTAKPLLYKITGTWGNHEGSILLWCWVLAFYSAAMTLWRDDALPLPVRAHALHIMGGIQAIFLAYTASVSNPFAPIFPVPVEGMGLNPLLQDIGLAMHPPLLYLGYVGCVAPFALSLGALVSGHLHTGNAQHFARALHPWIIAPWMCLTMGIALGSWWAYRELGWGGWWFWDPVENASLLPWLALTALFHAALVMRKRGNFQRWVILLALLAFCLSMLGTFLVRSGILTSVHSFASDPTRGYAVLAMLAAIAGYGLVAYLRYGAALPHSTPVKLLSREMAILANNLLLVLSIAAIATAMVYPLVVELMTGRMVTIGTGYYNGVFTALMLPLLAICALSTVSVWGGGKAPQNIKRSNARCAAIAGLAALVFGVWQGISALGIAGLALGGWVVLVCVVRAWQYRNQPVALKASAAMLIGHTGLGIFTIAATLHGALHTQTELVMQAGQSKRIGEVEFSLPIISHGQGANYIHRTGSLVVKRGGDSVQLYPEERYYPTESEFTSEAAILSFLTHDDYATMKRVLEAAATSPSQSASSSPDASPPVETVVIQYHHNPAMLWLWGGVGLMVLAGGIALFHYIQQRNHRIHTIHDRTLS